MARRMATKDMSLMIRLGKWMLTERGLFRLRQHRSVKNQKTKWMQWDKVL